MECTESLFGTVTQSNVVTRVEFIGSNPVYHTDVIIIGNGPSALALSALLSGHRPFYNVKNAHPSAPLHAKLLENASSSILDQDLAYLADGLEGRSSNPASLLYDSLVRPEADIGHSHPSCLDWKLDASLEVPHIVLGSGKVGGSWTSFQPDALTLSYGSWLDLPAFSFEQFLAKKKPSRINFSPEQRVPCCLVGHYFEQYKTYMGLAEHFLDFTQVTSVQLIDQGVGQKSGAPLWEVVGCHATGLFRARAPKLVLATGLSIPRHVGAPGEDLSFVCHSVTEMEFQMNKLSLGAFSSPVAVIGAGLTAADAIIKLLYAGISVVHIFRRSARDSQGVLNRLNATMFSEYHMVAQLMRGKRQCALYTPRERSIVQNFQGAAPGEQSVVVLRDDGQVETHLVSLAVVLAGYEAQLDFIAPSCAPRTRLAQTPVDGKRNVLLVEPFSSRCMDLDGLYALGPLVGDNFVRYCVGGALAACANMTQSKLRSTEQHSGS